jgi:GNAT superfamily N-acetyltransferase
VAPTGKWHIPFTSTSPTDRAFLGIFGIGGLGVMGIMDRIEKVHPREPHYYLQAVGTDPSKQGKGYGGVVIRKQLANADAQGMPAYLESSKDDEHPHLSEPGFRTDRRDQAAGRADALSDVAKSPAKGVRNCRSGPCKLSPEN